MRIAVAVARLGIAGALAVALVVSAAAAARRFGTGYDFLAYFTAQTSILAVAALVLSGAFLLARGAAPAWVHLLRGAAVAYALVMASCRLLIALPWQGSGGFPLPAANVFVCLVAPVLLLADWALVGDRRPLSHSFLRWIGAYPVLWSTLTLLRGIDTGWTPYPLLNPATAGARMPLFLAGTGLVALAAGAIVSWMSRRASLLPMGPEARAIEPTPLAPTALEVVASRLLDVVAPEDEEHAAPTVASLAPQVAPAAGPLAPGSEPAPLRPFAFVDPPPARADGDDEPEA